MESPSSFHPSIFHSNEEDTNEDARSIPLDRGEGWRGISGGLTDGNLPVKRSNWTVREREREGERTVSTRDRDSLTKQGMKRVEERFYRVSLEPKQRYTRSFSLSLSLSSWLINRPCQTLRNHANGCSFVISCFMERDYVARTLRTRRSRLDRRCLASRSFFYHPTREKRDLLPISNVYFYKNRWIKIWQLHFQNFRYIGN